MLLTIDLFIAGSLPCSLLPTAMVCDADGAQNGAQGGAPPDTLEAESEDLGKALDCITMSAPLDAIRVLLIGFGRKEPEFGSYAGQLDTGHGVR